MDLADQARQVLAANRRGDWTCPAARVYPHQWLWDAGFIALGLATYDPTQAVREIQSALLGQWRNGMLPHIIFHDDHREKLDDFWGSTGLPLAPQGVHTSGITQPPVLTIAAARVAERLGAPARTEFLTRTVPPLMRYHQWLYRERDPGRTGRVVLLHPWEVGLDNTPPWMAYYLDLPVPWWTNLLRLTRLVEVLAIIKQLSPGERPTLVESLKLYSLAIRLREAGYDASQILRQPTLAVESLVFNCILVQANRALAKLAQLAQLALPTNLAASFAQTESTIEHFWDEPSQQYFARNFHTGYHTRQPSIATFMPLFSGAISPQRAGHLVKLLLSPESYWPHHPVPTVPLNSPYFNERRYWQGPAWVNTNWLIIQGLRQYGYRDEAAVLTAKTLELVRRAGFREYYSPLTGQGFGAHNFSWTAALTLDLLAD